MSDSPLISVILPVRDLRRYVSSAIDSILAQTLGDFELLAVDDGSTDGTSEVLLQYAKKDPRVRVLRGRADGIAKAMNMAVSEARGELVARMDGDDLSVPTRFEKQVRFLRENPQHVLVGSLCMMIDPEGRPICEKPGMPQTHEQIDVLLLEMKWPLVHPAVMIRANAIAKIGGYNERYRTVEDHDLFLRLAEIGKLANLGEVLLLYRQHFKSAMHTTVDLQRRTLMEIVTQACARRGIPVPESVKYLPPELISELEHRRNWVWWALAAGNPGTARHHAWAVVRGLPFSKESWMAFLCALRGH
jgi:glycosyltransferase involved in cell wall biosynthesis